MDSSGASILPFIRAVVAPGSMVITDGLGLRAGSPAVNMCSAFIPA